MKVIGKILVAVLGIASLILFFLRLPFWAGVTFMTMGILASISKIKGGELCVVIGLIPILLHFQQMKLLIVLNFIILMIAIYDGVVLIRISQNLTTEDKKERQNEFNEQFRQKELVHVLCVRLGNLIGLE